MHDELTYINRCAEDGRGDAEPIAGSVVMPAGLARLGGPIAKVTALLGRVKLAVRQAMARVCARMMAQEFLRGVSKRVLSCALALALVAPALVPAMAWASTSEGSLGLNIEVPFTKQAQTEGAVGKVGININVPETIETDVTVETNKGERSAVGMLGINIEFPSIEYQQETGAVGLLGINIEMPETSESGDPESPGNQGERSAVGVMGINIEIPATEQQQTVGAVGQLGIKLSVPTGTTVFFDPNGGAGGGTVTVEAGAVVEQPENPTWPNHRFTGWYQDKRSAAENNPDGLYKFDDAVLGAITLFAGWEEVPEEEMVYPDLKLHMNLAETEPSDRALVEPTSEYPYRYTETALDGGATDYIYERHYKAGFKDRLVLPTSSHVDYTFGGWYATPDCTGSPVKQISHLTDATQEYWAKWDAKFYQVRFDTQGGSAVAAQKVQSGNAIASPVTPTRNGYDFAGWFVDPECTQVYDMGAPVREDKTLYAKWIAEVKEKFTVTFNYQDGLGTTTTETVEKDAVATSFVPSRPSDADGTSYVFEGWFTDAACTAGNEYDFATPVVSDLALYAKWREVPPTPANKLTVTFDSNGGSAVPSVTDVAPGSTVSEPETPLKAGWIFAGWYETSDFSGDKWKFAGEDDADEVTANLVLHAKWDLALDVTVPMSVTFSVNAATGDVMAPEMNAFQVKSRTIAPVQIDKVELNSQMNELNRFFRGADEEDPDVENGEGSAIQLSDLEGTKIWFISEDAATDADYAGLGNGLGVTELGDSRGAADSDSNLGAVGSGTSRGAGEPPDGKKWVVKLGLDGEEVVNDDGLPVIRSSWTVADGVGVDAAGRPEGHAQSFSISAFDVSDLGIADAAEKLGMQLGMKINGDKLKVILYGENDREITHVLFTISASTEGLE